MSATLHIFNENAKAMLVEQSRPASHVDVLEQQSFVQDLYANILSCLYSTGIANSDMPAHTPWFVLTSLYAFLYAKDPSDREGPVLQEIQRRLQNTNRYFNCYTALSHTDILRSLENQAIEHLNNLGENIKNSKQLMFPGDRFDYLIKPGDADNNPVWGQFKVHGFNAQNCLVQIKVDPDYWTPQNKAYLHMATENGYLPYYKLQAPTAYFG